VESITAKEFRREKVNILDYTAIILSSKTAIEHLFILCQELRLELPQDMKYFCVTETIALYLQKFINYRKRKVFFPKTREAEFYDLLVKHKAERFFLPISNIAQNEIKDYLKKNGLQFQEAMVYRTVSSDLSDLAEVNFDIIAFFTPYAIQSLYDNFPDFVQNETRIAAFGPITKSTIVEKGLRLDIEAPSPQSPSMISALEEYIKKMNK
jgi:uroporphyrinogen-III synthase